MSWNSISQNQEVSFNNLKDAIDTDVFEEVSTPITGINIVIKPEVTTYARINTAWDSYANKTSLECIAKRDLVPLFDCATVLTNFQNRMTAVLSAASGSVTVTGSGLTPGDQYQVRYPATASGSVIATSSAVNSVGNFSLTFTFTYSGASGINILVEKVGI